MWMVIFQGIWEVQKSTFATNLQETIEQSCSETQLLSGSLPLFLWGFKDEVWDEQQRQGITPVTGEFTGVYYPIYVAGHGDLLDG